MKILSALSIFTKTREPRPEVEAAQESSKRVVDAARLFNEHTDVLGNMVSSIRGRKPRKIRGKQK